MHARRMRMELLALLGVPALDGCTPAATPEPSAAPIIDVAPVASATPPDPEPNDIAVTESTFAACDEDHYRDWVCGQTTEERIAGGKTNPFATCPSHSDRIARRPGASVPLGLPSEGPLALDVHLTNLYREREAQRLANRTASVERDLCCYSACRRAEVQRTAQALPAGYVEVTRCINAMDRTSVPAAGDPSCPQAIAFDLGPDGAFAAGYNEAMTAYYNTSIRHPASALPDMKLCCYRSLQKGRQPGDPPIIIRGRPLRHGSEPVLAHDMVRGDWVSPGPTSADRGAWREAAATEHASVAAFARLALELLAVGAPPELIADAHRAAIDEIRHARLSYGLASRDTLIGPAPLALPALQLGDVDAIAVASMLEGCVGETAAALAAHHAADADGDTAVASIHRAIAEDEERHAALGWRIVAWCLTRSPTARDAVAAALANVDDNGDPIRNEALREVVRPCAQRVLSG